MNVESDTQPTHGLAAYRRVLAAPGVAAAAIAVVLAAIQTGSGAVGLVLYVHAVTGSFAAAGAAAGAFTIGLGVTGPPLARLIDRFGPRPVLIPSSFLGAAGMAAVVGLGDAGAGPLAMAAAAGLGGCAMPPVGGVLRRQWPDLISAHDLPTAYAFDAILIEVLFIGGPLLAGGLAATIGPGGGILVCAGVGLVGMLWFALLPLAAGRGHRRSRRGGPGVFSARAMRVVILAGVPLGCTFGALDVALPAFGVVHGSSALGGPFTAALAVGSALGGAFFGARPHIFGDPVRSFFTLRLLQVITCVPVLLAFSVPSMFFLAALAGLTVAPVGAVRSRLVHASAPPEIGTEAFTWISLSITVGASSGAAIAGPLVQSLGWRAGVVLAFAVPALGLLIRE